MFLNKAQEYLQEYKHIPHIKKQHHHNVWQSKLPGMQREVENMTHNEEKDHL